MAAEVSEGEVEMEDGELQEELDEEVMRLPGAGLDLPDLLKEIGGADSVAMDAETADKISARAVRFKTGGAIDYDAVSRLYSGLGVSTEQRETVDRLEIIHVWTPDEVNIWKLFASFT